MNIGEIPNFSKIPETCQDFRHYGYIFFHYLVSVLRPISWFYVSNLRFSCFLSKLHFRNIFYNIGYGFQISDFLVYHQHLYFLNIFYYLGFDFNLSIFVYYRLKLEWKARDLTSGFYFLARLILYGNFFLLCFTNFRFCSGFKLSFSQLGLKLDRWARITICLARAWT